MSATSIQRRRGDTAQHEIFTGQQGELTVDTEKKVVVVHDGQTPGGFPMLPASALLSNLFCKETRSPLFGLASLQVVTTAAVSVGVGSKILTYPAGTVVTVSTLASGSDYAFYATEAGIVASENFTLPTGFTSDTSRRIGGGHYGNGEWKSYSFYDLHFRPAVDDPRGKVYSPLGQWVSIYLLNTMPDLLGTSAYNATIADGASPPKTPEFWGGNGVLQEANFDQSRANKVLAAYGERLPTYEEFQVLARGCTTGNSNGVDPVTTQFDVDSESNIGCEQVCGHMWQWGQGVWDRGDGSSSYTKQDPYAHAEGGVYMSATSGVGAPIFGEDWSPVSAEPGSLALYVAIVPWHSSSPIGARGVCDHLQLT